MMEQTTEQKDAIVLIQQPTTKLLKVDSVAGSGKSYLLKLITNTLKPSTARYLVFGKALEKEAKRDYRGTNVKVSTTHALPFKYVVTDGLVDNISARGYFEYLVKKYGKTLNLSTEWTQEKLSCEGFDLIEELVGADIAFDIIDSFDDWLETKRELDTSFGPSSIKEGKDSAEKKDIYRTFEAYCNSKHIKLKDFLLEVNKIEYLKIITKYMQLMVYKQISVPFFFNLKYYQILLKQKIVYPDTLDLLMIDEVQDSSEVVLEIFRALPAKKKVMVGDTYQAIYGTFAHCTNGFDYFSKYGVSTRLTRSFRVPIKIAERIERFGQLHMNPNFQFKGTDTPYPEHSTTLYVSRTNAGLIQTMIDLQEEGIQYTLTRSVKDVFGLIKVLIYLSVKSPKIYNTKYNYLEEDVRKYSQSIELQTTYKSLLSYIKHVHEDNVEIQVAIATINEKTRDVLIKTMNEAFKREKNRQKNCPIVLGTSHASKGSTHTEVYINNDFKLDKILEKPLVDRTKEEQETIYNYYVACSRASHNLYNSKYL